ncbi:hypothetical protein PR202_gb07484 [Eleusine coracana subsp. coracana]|uniref:Casein kinase II subunit beta n=1 Tax=Eleusine coracana subsp. coracana TaxID=191504 RepID=A0AAV5ECD5_ELECO|nr:hypothetical protein PR202_gb07484 [Eleusine coracana subsp. coracana]
MDRKRIKDALEKHLERSSPSTSRGTAKERERLAAGKLPVSLGKGGKVSDAGKNLEQEFETDSEDSDVSGSEGEDTSWISWFCSLRGNEFFCEIDDDYIQDDFNLCGLSNQVPYYDYALDLILDIESSNGDVFTDEQNELIESSAEMLYGLIHARYILTSKGLAAMLEKFKNYDFGRCPRVYCCGQPCLPAGQSDIPRSSTVKIYCPKCEELHYPRSKFSIALDQAMTICNKSGWKKFVKDRLDYRKPDGELAKLTHSPQISFSTRITLQAYVTTIALNSKVFELWKD